MAAENAAEKTEKRRRNRKSDAETPSAAITEGKGKATPSRRSQDTGSDGNFLTRPIGGISTYFQEVQSELTKVTWPTRPEIAHLTRIVLLVTVAASIVLGLLSAGMSVVIRAGLDLPVILYGIIVGALVVSFWAIRRSNSAGGRY